MVRFRELFALVRSESDEDVLEILNNSPYTNVKVVGRGTIYVDPQEVIQTAGFKDTSERVEEIRRSELQRLHQQGIKTDIITN